MLCKHCGAAVEEDNLFCPECGQRCAEETPVAAENTEIPETVAEEAPEAPKSAAEETAEAAETAAPVVSEAPVTAPSKAAVKAAKQQLKKKKPHILVRILMQLISLVLCTVLLAAVLGTAVLADLNTLTSSGGINKLIHAVLNPAPASPRMPVVGALGVHLDDPTVPEGLEDMFDKEGNLELEIPDNILAGGENAVGELIDYIFVQVEEQMGEELPITSEQLQTIVEESTVTDFLSEKLEGYADDFLNGTANTVITSDEVLGLLEENQELIERVLNVEITEQFKQEFTQAVDQVIEENDINNVIHESLNSAVNDMLEQNTASLGGLNYDDVRQIIAFAASDQLLYTAIGICAVLLLLLCLANWYNVPAGLTWASWPCILVGLVLSAPIYVLQRMPDLLGSLLGDGFAAILSVISSAVRVLAPIHYGLLFIGVGLLVISLVWRIIRSVVRNQKAKALAAA